MHSSCVNIDMLPRCFFFFLMEKILSKTNKWWYLCSGRREEGKESSCLFTFDLGL